MYQINNSIIMLFTQKLGIANLIAYPVHLGHLICGHHCDGYMYPILILKGLFKSWDVAFLTSFAL